MNFTLRQRLDKPGKDGRCYLFLDVTWPPRQRATLPTSVKCLPAHFKPGNARPVSVKDPASARLNARLANLQVKVTKAATIAEADDVPLTVEMLRQAIGATPKKAAGPIPPVLTTPTEFHTAWLTENPGMTPNSARRYKQVVAHLEAYHPDWPITKIGRADFLAYMAHVAGLGLVDSTADRHVKFIRECFRMAGLAVPTWLKMQVRYGRSPALQADELRRLIALPVEDQPFLSQARDLFLFQTMLLLRDSDLRQLRPHHVTQMDLPGVGQVAVMSIRQMKTGDEVRLPLPPAAVAIWDKYAGLLPVTAQQYRNRQMKELMELAGLTRAFVRVRYLKSEAVEQVVPLWQVVTTHTARHTGADMVMLGSLGDSNLKEKALGHAGVYGHDALERYGPALLRAWSSVLSISEKDNTAAPNTPGSIRDEVVPKHRVLRIGDYNLPLLTK